MARRTRNDDETEFLHNDRARPSGPSTEGAVTSSHNRRKSRPGLNEATWGASGSTILSVVVAFDLVVRAKATGYLDDPYWARHFELFLYRTPRPTVQTRDGEACPGVAPHETMSDRIVPRVGPAAVGE